MSERKPDCVVKVSSSAKEGNVDFIVAENGNGSEPGRSGSLPQWGFFEVDAALEIIDEIYPPPAPVIPAS